MNKMDLITILIVLAFVLLSSVLGFFGFQEHQFSSVVRSLNKEGWKVYLDTSSCGFCVRQVKFLGEHMADVNAVHCDDEKNREKCKHIKGFPTSEKDGKLVPGSRFSLESLRELLLQ